MKARQMFLRLINENSYKKAVEIGVYKGQFARYLMCNSCLDYLLCIDPWENADGTFNDFLYNECLNNLKPYADKVEIRVNKSLEVANQFTDGFFDFVYIDGNHSYQSTKEDIEAWYPKVKAGGICAGHDYKNNGYAISKLMSFTGRGRCRVKKAVDEFAEENNLELNVSQERCNNWWIFK